MALEQDTGTPDTTADMRGGADPSPPFPAVPSIVASIGEPSMPGGTYGSIPGASPGLFDTGGKDYDVAVKAETENLEKKIGADRLADRNYEDREARYRGLQERALHATAAGIDDLKPWNAQEALAATK